MTSWIRTSRRGRVVVLVVNLRNKLQVASYPVDAQLEKAILSAKGSTEKEKIAATVALVGQCHVQWNQIKNCPCEKVDLDVRFTDILSWIDLWVLHNH